MSWSTRPSSRPTDTGWLAKLARDSAAKRKSPERSPVNMRPVRFAPWAAGASPSTMHPGRAGRRTPAAGGPSSPARQMPRDALWRPPLARRPDEYSADSGRSPRRARSGRPHCAIPQCSSSIGWDMSLWMLIVLLATVVKLPIAATAAVDTVPRRRGHAGAAGARFKRRGRRLKDASGWHLGPAPAQRRRRASLGVARMAPPLRRLPAGFEPRWLRSAGAASTSPTE